MTKNVSSSVAKFDMHTYLKSNLPMQCNVMKSNAILKSKLYIKKNILLKNVGLIVDNLSNLKSSY